MSESEQPELRNLYELRLPKETVLKEKQLPGIAFAETTTNYIRCTW